jgi:hypothetical protein
MFGKVVTIASAGNKLSFVTIPSGFENNEA